MAQSIPPGLAGRRLPEMTLLSTSAAAVLALALALVRDASRHRRACIASFQTNTKLIQITNRCHMDCKHYKNFECRFPKEMEMLKK